MITKLKVKEDAVMQWQVKAVNPTTNLKVEIDLSLPKFWETKSLMCNFHVGDSVKGRYDMILGRNLLTVLGLNSKFSTHTIEGDYKTLKESITPTVDLGTHEFNI